VVADRNIPVGGRVCQALSLTQLEGPTLSNIHLVACGNTLCGDDGAGPVLLEELRQLKKQGVLSSSVRMTTAERGVSTWRRLLRREERVIFLDAGVGIGPGGSVGLMRLTEETLEGDQLQHGVHPLQLFLVEQTLYPEDLPDEAWLCVINAPCGPDGPLKEAGTGLSKEMKAGVEAGEQLLIKVLNSWHS
jgi:hydrogenase maturation protease